MIDSHLKQTELTQPAEGAEGLLPFDEFLKAHPSIVDQIKLIDDIRTKRAEFDELSIKARGYQLLTSNLDLPKLSDIEGFLGIGHEKAAFLVDGEYVLKSQNNIFPISPPEKQIQALRAGIGVEGLEQLVTADLSTGTIVTKLAKGRSLPTIPSKELVGKIKKEHLKKLKATLQWMSENMLEYDNAYNILFDPQEGFTIIDYRPPIALGDGQPSANPDDDNYSAGYAHFRQSHTLDQFLKNVLTNESRTNKSSSYDTHGNLQTYVVPTIGRSVVKMLVPKIK